MNIRLRSTEEERRHAARQVAAGESAHERTHEPKRSKSADREAET